MAGNPGDAQAFATEARTTVFSCFRARLDCKPRGMQHASPCFEQRAGLLQFWVHLFGEQKPFPMGMAARIGNALRFELNFGMGCKAYVLQSLLKLGRPRVSFSSVKLHFVKGGSCGDGSSSQS